MSATTVKLLEVASEIVGGDAALARALGISEAMLSRFMADKRHLPSSLLLRIVDIILGDPLSLPVTSQRVPQRSEDPIADG